MSWLPNASDVSYSPSLYACQLLSSGTCTHTRTDAVSTGVGVRGQAPSVSVCWWGWQAFTGYLGENKKDWEVCDEATACVWQLASALH